MGKSEFEDIDLTEDQERRVWKLLREMGFSTGSLPDVEGTGEKIQDIEIRGVPMGATDRSIWFCSRCVSVITDLEYKHLNLNGRCDECEGELEQYEKVEWRP